MPSPATTSPATSSVHAALYRAIWRWHFYAGLLCLPFLISLAVSGGTYLFKDEVSAWLYRDLLFVTSPPFGTQPLNAEAVVARAATNGSAVAYLPPPGPDRSARVVVEVGDELRAVFVDPYRGTVQGSVRQGDRGNLPFVDVLRRLHSLEIVGTLGNRLVEIVAGWALILVVTGVYLWWPRGRAGGALSVRGTAHQRVFWRDLHAVTGVLAAVFVAFLATTGLPWSGVWGNEFKRIVNGAGWGYPTASAHGAASAQVQHHAAGHEAHLERPGALAPVAWALDEEAPRPLSAVTPGAAPIGLDRAVARFTELGLASGYTVTLPTTATAVYAASLMPDQIAGARSIQLDQYTGAVLEDTGYADFGPAARAIELGTSIHTGQEFGRLNQLAMLGACLAIVTLAVTAAVMWWKRRPRGALGAPRYPEDFRLPRAILIVAVVVGTALPLVGASILAMLAIDASLPGTWRERI